MPAWLQKLRDEECIREGIAWKRRKAWGDLAQEWDFSYEDMKAAAAVRERARAAIKDADEGRFGQKLSKEAVDVSAVAPKLMQDRRLLLPGELVYHHYNYQGKQSIYG